MKQGYLAILDSDGEYVGRLGHYLNDSEFMMLRVLVFSSQEKFDAFLEKEKVDMILVRKNMWKEEYEEKNGIVLCDSLMDTPENISWIYKYQSARTIGQEIMDSYAKRTDTKVICSNKKIKTDILAVFPVGDDSLGTIFAWELAKVLGRSKRTLYVNLKSFSGMRSKLGGDWREDLSDCIYFLRKGEGNIAVKLQALIRQEEGIFSLPPAWSEEDISSVSKEEWRQLLGAITQGLSYERVVLDLSEAAAGFSFWLEECDYIFTPVAGFFAETRTLERKKWMENRVAEQVLKKWICFSGEKLKDMREFSVSEDSQARSYVNHILRENGVLDGEI